MSANMEQKIMESMKMMNTMSTAEGKKGRREKFKEDAKTII